jgi:Flp pilus assembly protein TadD
MSEMTAQQALELARQQHQAGQLQQAAAICRQVLATQPDNAEALHLLGLITFQSGQVAQAFDLIRRAIAINPSAIYYQSNLGHLLTSAGRADEAIALLRQLLAANPDYPDAHKHLGAALFVQGQLDQAIATFRKVLLLRPNSPDSYNDLGVALLRKGQAEQAELVFRRAIELTPNSPEAHFNLGNALRAQNQFPPAIAAFEQAIALQPSYADAHNNLGDALQSIDRMDEAISAYRQVLSLQPDDPQARNNLADALQNTHQLDEAIAAFREAVARAPQNAVIHQNLGMALLLAGDFAQGWPEYEWRRQAQQADVLHMNVPRPRWNGQNLNGQTILLHAEQGFGDAMQFVRYAPLIAQQSGGKVVLACPPELLRLFQSVDGVAKVATQGDALPPIDVECPLPSLPMAMNTTLETIPAHVPYLRAEPELSTRWRARLGADRLKVGLVWAGRALPNPNRSVSPEKLRLLGQVPGVAWVSLQKTEGSAPVARSSAPFELLDWTSELLDFVDTAALIDNLDLVITVDTAVAHLAGAMGKPVWVLLLYAPDWRWMLDRNDLPWYPTMRLFRQPTIGDWDTPVEQIAQDVQSLAAGRAQATT